MNFFIDTANLADIIEINDMGVIAGVTTNPTLVAKEGVDFHARIKEICEVVAGPVSAEVIMQLTKHPLTDAGIERFLADWRAIENKG